MGERKVLNKYIPADFDPSLVPKGKKLSAKDGTVPVRMMLPFSIQCSTCNEFLYRGRKFNSKKEAMGGPDGKYLGITRWRFYIKCTSCARPLTFLTDPENADYTMESGGTRNYEVYKDKAKTEEEAEAEKEQEEKEDPMKALENRVLDSQREMADLDNLEEIKAMNARHVKLMAAAGNQKDFEAETKALLEAREKQANKHQDQQQVMDLLTEEDEALVRSIQFGRHPSPNKSTMMIRRLDDVDEERIETERQAKAKLLEEQQRQLANKITTTQQKATTASRLPILKIKRKRAPVALKEEPGSRNKTQKTASATTTSTSTTVTSNGGGGLAGLLGGYSSSESE